MTTFIKTKFKIRRILKSIEQLQILRNIIIYLTKNRNSKIYDDKAITSCEKFPVEKNKIDLNQGNWTLSGSDRHLR